MPSDQGLFFQYQVSFHSVIESKVPDLDVQMCRLIWAFFFDDIIRTLLFNIFIWECVCSVLESLSAICQAFSAAQQLLSLELSVVEKQKLDR